MLNRIENIFFFFFERFNSCEQVAIFLKGGWWNWREYIFLPGEFILYSRGKQLFCSNMIKLFFLEEFCLLCDRVTVPLNRECLRSRFIGESIAVTWLVMQRLLLLVKYCEIRMSNWWFTMNTLHVLKVNIQANLYIFL